MGFNLRGAFGVIGVDCNTVEILGNVGFFDGDECGVLGKLGELDGDKHVTNFLFGDNDLDLTLLFVLMLLNLNWGTPLAWKLVSYGCDGGDGGAVLDLLVS